MNLLATISYKTITTLLNVRYELAELGAWKCQKLLVCRAKQQNKPQLLKLFLQLKDFPPSQKKKA